MLAGILETAPPAVILFSVGMLGWMLLMLIQNEIAIRQIDASIKEWARQFDSDENAHCSSEQVPVGAGGAHTVPLHPISRVNSAGSRKTQGSSDAFSRVNSSSSGCASPQMRPLPKKPSSRASSTAVPPQNPSSRPSSTAVPPLVPLNVNIHQPHHLEQAVAPPPGLLPRSASLSPPRPDGSRSERLLYITRGRSVSMVPEDTNQLLYTGGTMARAVSFSPPKSARANTPAHQKSARATRRTTSPVTRPPVRPFSRTSSTSGIEPQRRLCFSFFF
jgi:hypothetical protein